MLLNKKEYSTQNKVCLTKKNKSKNEKWPKRHFHIKSLRKGQRFPVHCPFGLCVGGFYVLNTARVEGVGFSPS